MSAPTSCLPCNPQVTTTNVPGSTGASAVTTTTASFNLPAVGATVLIHVGDTSWMKVGKNVFISDGANVGNFIVTSVNSSTSFTGEFLLLPNDNSAGSPVSSGAIVMPGLGNFTVPFDLDALTSFTDNSGGTKSDTIASTAFQSIEMQHIPMPNLVNGQVWKCAIPSAFKVISAVFRCDVAITTGAKAATLTTQINGVPCTGGVIVVSGTYATGTSQAGTAITANNVGTAGQTLEFAVSAVTPFTEGLGHVELTYQDMDMAATIAAIADKLNTLRAALRHG